MSSCLGYVILNPMATTGGIGIFYALPCYGYQMGGFSENNENKGILVILQFIPKCWRCRALLIKKG